MNQCVSVIIPTLNRQHTLEKVLPSYENQECVKEIIIIDDGSTDGTREFLKRVSSESKKITYELNPSNIGIPGTRNIGANIALGEFIFFGEDDLWLPSAHIRTLLEHLEKTRSDIIAGRRIWMNVGETYDSAMTRANNKKGAPYNQYIFITDCEVLLNDDEQLPMLDASMLIKKEIFNKVQYENENSRNLYWREETDFQMSCNEIGYKLTYCPHTACFHLPKINDKGGAHRKKFLDYELGILRNNWFFLNKHKEYLEDNFGFRSIYLSFIVFFLHRMFIKNLFPRIVKLKKTLFS